MLFGTFIIRNFDYNKAISASMFSGVKQMAFSSTFSNTCLGFT